MAKYNIIAKCVKGQEYLMKDMIATRLSKAKFEKVKELNKELFDDSEQYTWRFIPYKETDFSWWYRIDKELTSARLKSACFECQYNGDIVKY